MFSIGGLIATFSIPFPPANFALPLPFCCHYFDWIKRFLIFSRLLFSGSPALADDVLSRECKTTTRAIFIEIKTQKLIKEETKEETLFLKIDLAKNRFMSHKDSQWDEAEMTDRSLKSNLNKNENGFSLNATLEIEINPPG